MSSLETFLTPTKFARSKLFLACFELQVSIASVSYYNGIL